MSANSVPVTVRGKVYPSMSAAARELGVSPQSVWDAVERGNTDGVGLGRNWWRKKKGNANDRR